ncbi:ankyrin repeat domain-containing protein [Spirochaeta isovalerica]|uniref:Ankyrin repeat protein n=1 Tax=Spirochaeta isovalerica TaxID=150 RepID=A0A841RI53_9SPIO|nr:ankyrin repeat domain-containing protein [Spirochaeta isovalerica]MBB6482439.1 ankyrin repeat protein [Spirochaeta isovalerica]
MKKLSLLILGLTILVLIGSCASAEVRAVRKGDIEEIRKFLADGGDPDTIDKDGNALIHIAVQYGRADSLDVLLQAGADANMKNADGNTAAILAAGSDRRDMIDILIRYGGDMRTRGRRSVSTLMLAASKGNVSLMDILLKLGVPIEGTDDDGRSALFYSISAAGPEALSFLLDKGADARAVDKNNGTPLHLLKQNRQAVLASMLLDKGTDVALSLHSSNETALHIAAGAGAWQLVETYLAGGAAFLVNQPSSTLGAPLFYALNEKINPADGAATVELLLASGADPNTPSIKNKLPIVQAVEKLDVRRAELLLRWGADTDVFLISRKSLLHIAVERKNVEMAGLLLNYNIDPDIRDMYGKTPLFYAVENGDEPMVQFLLSNGSNPDINSHDGTNMLYLVLKKDSARSSGFSSMGNLLLRYGASVRSSRDPLHPLLLQAAQSGNEAVLSLLLDSGANPNATEADGVTALMLTSSKNYSDLSALLIRSGAVVNAVDKKGNTALHIASRTGSVATVEILLRYGAAPDPVNYDNLRPIELAPDNAQGDRIVELLLAAGAAPLPVEAPVPEEPVVVVPPSGDQPENPEAADGTVTVVDNGSPEEPTPADPSGENGSDSELWNKAKVLVLGTDEPRNVSRDRTSFQGYSASVPVSFPRNMYSKFNNRNVNLFIRNETGQSAEIYIVNANGVTEAVSLLQAGRFLELGSKEGNIYPVYSSSSIYFGDIKATGQQTQYFRLVQR